MSQSGDSIIEGMGLNSFAFASGCVNGTLFLIEVVDGFLSVKVGKDGTSGASGLAAGSSGFVAGSSGLAAGVVSITTFPVRGSAGFSVSVSLVGGAMGSLILSDCVNESSLGGAGSIGSSAVRVCVNALGFGSAGNSDFGAAVIGIA